MQEGAAMQLQKAEMSKVERLESGKQSEKAQTLKTVEENAQSQQQGESSSAEQAAATSKSVAEAEKLGESTNSNAAR